MTSQPRPSRRQSAPQLLQKALCTAPATQKEAAAQPATIRAAGPSEGSVYCACHAKISRGPAGDNPRHNSFRRLCVLRLPGREKPRPSRRQSAPQLLQKALCIAPATQREAAAQPATIRAATPSEGSVYCACQAERSRGPAGDNPRRSSFRRRCVLRLPRREKPRPSRRQSAPQLLQEPLCTAPATHGPAGDNPRPSSFRRLCVLRLPRKGEPRPSRRQSAPQLLQKALCTAPATQREAAAQPATIRAPAPSGASVYCACHAKRSRGPAGDNPRPSSFRSLCVLRRPRKGEPRPSRRQSAAQLLQEALSTAPAKQHVCEMRCVR